MIIRLSTSAELHRATWFFRHRSLPDETIYFVTLEKKPRPRFLGVLALWENSFLIACQPGLEMTQIAPGLIDALFASGSFRRPLRYHDLLSEEEPLFALLRKRCFEVVNRVRFFELEVDALRPRLSAVFLRVASAIPRSWQFLSLYSRPASEIRSLVVDRYSLMGGREFDDCVRSGIFDPSLSIVLWDGNELLGALLIVRRPHVLMIEAIAMISSSPRLRAFGNIGLLHASLRNRSPEDFVTRYEFRAGATDHIQTANTALRLGGREQTTKMSLEKKQ